MHIYNICDRFVVKIQTFLNSLNHELYLMGTTTTTGTKAIWEKRKDESGKEYSVQVGSVPVTTTYTTTPGGNTLVTQQTQYGTTQSEIIRQGSSGSGAVTGLSGGGVLVQEKTTTTQPQTPVFTSEVAQNLINKEKGFSPGTATSYKYGPGVGIYENKFLSLAGQKERIVNAAQTSKIYIQNVANPFNENTKSGRIGNIIVSPLIPSSKNKIKATKDVFSSTFVEKGVEFVANKPLIGAGVIATSYTAAPAVTTFLGGTAAATEGVMFTTKEYLKTPQASKEFGTTTAEYKAFKRSGLDIEVKPIVYGTISQETKGIFRGLAADIAPGTAPKEAKEKAFKNVMDYYMSKGYSQNEAEKLTKLAIRDYKTSMIVETAGIITVNAFSNKAGSLLLSKAEKTAKVLGTTNTKISYLSNTKYAIPASKFISRTRLGALAGPGALEGAYTVDIAETQRLGKARGKDVFLGGAVGAISAPLVQIGIDKPVNKLLTKTGDFKGRPASLSVLQKVDKGSGLWKSRAIQGLAYATDPAEFPGDVLDYAGTTTAKKVKVFTMSNTNTYSKTKTGTQIKNDIVPQTQQPKRQSIFTPTKTFTFEVIQSKTGTQVAPQSRVPTRTNPFTQVSTQTNTKVYPLSNVFNNVNTNLQTNVNTNTNTAVNTNTNTNTNVFVNPRAPPFIPGGGLGKGKGFGKGLSFKQSKGYTPTLFAATLNIKGSTKTSRARKQSGLDIRPI